MPLTQKPQPRTGPPDHRQEVAVSSIEGAFTDLMQTLTFVGRGHPDMRQIIGQLRGHVEQAKKWVLEN